MANTKIHGEQLKDSVVRFTAKAGENLTKGQAVYISGISGEVPVVSLADADDSAKIPAFGLAEATVSTNAEVDIISFGTLAGLDTSGYSLGDTLYVDTTAGALTNDPAGGETVKLQNIGKVQRVHASNGSIKVGGAGRTAATPNLNQGKIFIGDANNKSSTSVYTLPIADGTNGQYLQTDGAGTLSFSTVSGYTDSDVATYLGGGNTINIDTQGTIKLDGNYPTGTGNVALGDSVLSSGSLSGNNNTAVGTSAMAANTSGASNVAIGRESMLQNTTGTNNVAVGALSLEENTEGNQNTAIGREALENSTTADNNTAVGYKALTLNTTGANNVAVGALALDANTASSNTALGYNSLGANTSGNNNVAVGADCLDANTTGVSNVAVGADALSANTTASNNTAVGKSALLANTTGAENTAVGSLALDANTDGSSNVSIGYASLTTNTSGNYNTAVGNNALTNNTTASRNTAVGINALLANTTGAENVAVGDATLDANTTGSNITAVGRGALSSNTTASNNTANGYFALISNTTGAQNTASGAFCLYNLTTANYCTGLGYLAGQNMTTASENTLIGANAGNSITNGGRNTLVGQSTDVADNNGYQQVFGWNVTSAGNNSTTIGADSADSNLVNGGTTWTAPSDIRLKEDIQDEEVGLDFIKDLRPVTFLWKKEKDIPSHMKAYKEGSEERTMNGKYNHGFIAQEVKAVIDKHNLKEGFDMWSEDSSDGRQRIGDAALMPIMVKAVQELSAQNADLLKRIEALES